MARKKDARIVYITNRRAERLKRKKKEFIVWDEKVTGFGVRVLPSGTKTYIFNGRISAHKQCRLAIGRVGSITADDARQVALSWAAGIAKGTDPAAEKRKVYHTPTVRQLCEEYVGSLEGVAAEVTPAKYRRMLEHYVYPAMGAKLARDVTMVDVEGLRRVLEDKHATFNGINKILSAAYNRAIKKQVLGYNPARYVKLYKIAPRKRFLSNEELQKLAAAIERGNPSSVMLAAIRTIIWTGARPGEVLKLKWEDVMENCAGALDDAKTGARNIRITPPVLEIIKNLERKEGNPYIFASPTKPGRPIASVYLTFQALCKEAGIKNASPHTLRKTFASKALRNGVPLAAVAKILGHRDQRTTEQFYAFLADDDVAQAADSVSTEIADVMSTGAEKRGGRKEDEKLAALVAAMVAAGVKPRKAAALAKDALARGC